jgi:hypothetical protein
LRVHTHVVTLHHAARFGLRTGADAHANRASLAALFVIDGAGVIRWSYLSPVDVNPGADGILVALDKITVGDALRSGSNAQTSGEISAG